MAARLPKTVQIGPFNYTVTPLSKALAEDLDIYGDCNRMDKVIRVGADLNHQVKAETLLHEILHGCFDGGIFPLEEKDEERIVRILSPQLALVLRDNPKVVKFIIDGLRS